MNSCVLMVEIVGEAQMRQTQEGLTVTDVVVEFESTREGDSPSQIKLVGWGNLAEEMKNNYHRGDRIVVDGRLGMNLIEIDGYKEKRAELVASRIYPLSKSEFVATSSPQTEARFAPSPVSERSPNIVGTSTPEPVTTSPKVATAKAPVDGTDSPSDGDWDEIPF